MAPSIRLVLRALFLVALLVPVNARAEGWTPPVPLSEVATDLFASPQVGVTGNGTRISAGIEVTSLSPVLQLSMAVSSLAPGGAPITEMSIPGTATVQPYLPSLAVAPDGTAVLAWLEFQTPSSSAPLRIRAAYRRADGTWEAPTTVGTESVAGPFTEVDPPAVAIRGGVAAVATGVAEPNDPGETVIDRVLRVSVRAAGAWRPAVQVGPDDWSVRGAKLAIDGSGRVTWAAQLRTNDGNTTTVSDDVYSVETADISPSGVLSGRAQLSFGGVGMHPMLAVSEDGRAFVAYEHTEGGATTMRTSVRPAGGGDGDWPGAVDFAGTPDRPVGLTVDGNSVALLFARGYDVFAARAVGVAGFGVAARLNTADTEITGTPFGVGVAGGVVVLAAARAAGSTGMEDRIVAMRLLTGRATAEPVQVVDRDIDGGKVYGAQVDGEGSVVAAWLPQSSLSVRVRGAVLDRGAPQLDATLGTPLAGRSATLLATARDRWSAVTSGPSWRFADGGTAQGGQVSRVFDVPGNQAITLSATDAAGNVGQREVEAGVVAVGIAPIAPVGPSVTVQRPTCRSGASTRSCSRLRSRASSWRTLRGKAAHIPAGATIELAVSVRKNGRTSAYSGRRFATLGRGKQPTWIAAKVSSTGWSLRLRATPPTGSLRVVARVRSATGAVLATSEIRATLR